MRAIDTNILVRYLVEDPDNADQCVQAAECIEGALDEGISIFVSDIVIAETAWALKGIRPRPPSKPERIEVFRRCLDAAGLRFSDAGMLRNSLDAWERGSGDLADYIIGGHAAQAGAQETLTFDHALHGKRGFAAPFPERCLKCRKAGATPRQ